MRCSDEESEIHHRGTCVQYSRVVVETVPVISSTVAAIGYDDRSSILFVRFHVGAREYSYQGVSISLYKAFLAAPSKGRFLAWHIKGHYPYARVA